PPLLLAQRAGLHDPDAIPFAAGIGLIVGLEALAEAHPLPVEGMAHLPLHQHNHRLVHLVRDDDALPDLPPPSGLLRHRSHPLLRRDARFVRLVGCSASSRARMTDRTRAISRRTARRRMGLSSCPVAIWNRRLKSSSFRSAVPGWMAPSSPRGAELDQARRPSAARNRAASTAREEEDGILFRTPGREASRRVRVFGAPCGG